MPVQKMNRPTGVMGTKAAAAVKGFAAGGPIGAIMGLASANNPKLGAMASMLGGKGQPPSGQVPNAQNESSAEAGGLRMPELGQKFADEGRTPTLGVVPVENPLARRLSISDPKDHMSVIEEGLAGARQLADENPELYGDLMDNGVIPGMLQVKHYNLRGGR